MAQAGLELATLLPQPPKSWDPRLEPPCVASAGFVDSVASCTRSAGPVLGRRVSVVTWALWLRDPFLLVASSAV